MYRKYSVIGFVFLLFIGSLSFSACSAPKSGCPAEESRAKAIKANKKVRKHSKTELFPKDMKKKMNR